jgi:cell fate (sporulation/competence/biofilm development) regulator YmcA (YheA/YmcA/DUF963 family)
MTRNSPPEHAKDFKNKIRKGNDKQRYISLPDKNGIYKWKLISMKKSPEEYYSQFRKIKKIFNVHDTIKKLIKIAKELRKYHIYIVKFPWSKIWNMSGDQIADIREKLSEKYKVSQFHQDIYSFLTFDDNSRFQSEEDGKFCLFSRMLSKHLNIIHDKLIEYFGKQLQWSNKGLIYIKLPKK